MRNTPGIRILEADANRRGDLFGRLMGDLFLALGYGEVRLNIHKSGREVDIEAVHRMEPRRVVAECKATRTKVGGDAINKFVGVLDVERRKYNGDTTGYFISLSGFRETAVEQEKESGGQRVILIDGKEVVHQLVNGNIIASLDAAMERAGRCAAEQAVDLRPEAAGEILAHAMGWIRVVYFTRNKQRTHFALIHADGEAISPDLANLIIVSDASVKGPLASLAYLPPDIRRPDSTRGVDKARSTYLRYLAVECGEIQLEGLPADQQVGARNLNLENIFVPLHVQELRESGRDPSPSTGSAPDEAEKELVEPPDRRSIGSVLAESPRVAILAAPGGGKTTLIKRLAVAYAFPDRRALINDELPDRDWLPLFILCRQLGDLAKEPITIILRSIPRRAEMNELADAFEIAVNDALRNGKALLLLDGLDEISDEGFRVAFVHQLRTFLATYPSVNVVVTSREAGFRIVGGALASHCRHYQVSEFDDDDIRRLTFAWHKEVVGDRSDIRQVAENLADTICGSDRIKQLAQNPLLLTTLLLVNRWLGRIPTRRSVLYGKTIELLLMTWNVEGHTPVDVEEAIPQLAYVAFTMMKDGEQRISQRRLRELLVQARREMPEVLAYAQLGVSEFVERVELRSSLLSVSGYEVDQGTLGPVYEFRHLTFQEYFAAVAIARGFYPNRTDDDTIITVLEPFLEDESWEEVVPLVAVLAGRGVQPLVRHLIDLCRGLGSWASRRLRRVEQPPVSPVHLLAQCILDEIQVPPDMLEEALEWMSRREDRAGPTTPAMLYSGRHGETFANVVETAFLRSKTDSLDLASTLAQITLSQLGRQGSESIVEIAQPITALLTDDAPIRIAKGSLATMSMAFELWKTGRPRPRRVKDPRVNDRIKRRFQDLGDLVAASFHANEFVTDLSACWALVWLGESGLWSPERDPTVLRRLFDLWSGSKSIDLGYVAAWALTTLPLVDRDSKPMADPDPGVVRFVEQNISAIERLPNNTSVTASLVAAYYLRAPWTDQELAERIGNAEIGAWGNKDRLVEALAQPVAPRRARRRRASKVQRPRGSRT